VTFRKGSFVKTSTALTRSGDSSMEMSTLKLPLMVDPRYNATGIVPQDGEVRRSRRWVARAKGTHSRNMSCGRRPLQPRV
jgi:hypothetical protein